MANSILVDNDVILKMCCYGAIDELTKLLADETRSVHALGVALHVLRNAISRNKKIGSRELASKRLERFFLNVTLIEPDNTELLLATEFEEAARNSNVELDTGESQLLAVLIKRTAKLLLTGDKRAIRAIEAISVDLEYGVDIFQKVACLEQVVLALVQKHGTKSFQARICSEEEVDTSLAICFRCASGIDDPESIIGALLSYIRDVRTKAPNALVNSDDLSSIIA